MDVPCPPLEYLAKCSPASLESLELDRLGHAANLRKELHQVLQRWIEAEADARTARAILEWRRIAGSRSDPPPLDLPAAPIQLESSPAKSGAAGRQLALGFEPAESASAGVRAQIDRLPLAAATSAPAEPASVVSRLEVRRTARHASLGGLIQAGAAGVRGVRGPLRVGPLGKCRLAAPRRRIVRQAS